MADPDRVGTVLDQVGDVSVVAWLLGSAVGDAEAVASIHGPRLERLLEALVDTPVRGFVYDGEGTVPADSRRQGAELVREAGERWRIPVEIVEHDAAEWRGWVDAVRAAIHSLTGA